MSANAIYTQGWTLDDVRWSAFDGAKAEPWMIAAIKAAALVELNAPDYVSYLKRVLKDDGPETLAAIDNLWDTPPPNIASYSVSNNGLSTDGGIACTPGSPRAGPAGHGWR